jgi:sodium transport system permease protein
MTLALVALARDRDHEAPLVVAFDGRERAPSLAAFLEERRVMLVEPAAHPEALEALEGMIRDRSLLVALVVDGEYGARFAQARPAKVRLLYDGSSQKSSSDRRRLRELLEEYDGRVGVARLVLRGLAPDVASPLAIHERDLSTAVGRAATALATLPIFLLLATFIGGMNVASDTTAGERERGSLESLLHNPVPRLALAVGKWGAAFVLSTSTVVLTLLASGVALQYPRVQEIDLPIGLGTLDAAAVVVALLPLAMLAPALQLWVALFARSFKEAQTQLSLLLFTPMLPGFLLAFGSIPEARWMSFVPVLGQHILVRDILRGLPPQVASSAGLALFTVLAAAIAIILTARLLGEERILGGASA